MKGIHVSGIPCTNAVLRQRLAAPIFLFYVFETYLSGLYGLIFAGATAGLLVAVATTYTTTSLGLEQSPSELSNILNVSAAVHLFYGVDAPCGATASAFNHVGVVCHVVPLREHQARFSSAYSAPLHGPSCSVRSIPSLARAAAFRTKCVGDNVRRLHSSRRYRECAVAGMAAPVGACLLYTSPSPRDQRGSRMPSSA